jgi:DNA-binding response OmpR family regulator
LSTAEILIVEDDEVIMGTLAYSLSRQGFDVKGATTGAEALRLARKLRPDLILLDIMLPGESGIDVCERIRERDKDVVIVMVTAKDAEDDKVRGFEVGADDYVTKPFGMKELVARINANLKRSETGGRGKILEAGDLQLDTKNFTALVAGEPLDLRLKEFELLAALASAPGELRSREELAKEVWGHAGVGSSRTIDVHIRRIRAALEEKSSYQYIHTARGLGYRFEAKPKNKTGVGTDLDVADLVHHIKERGGRLPDNLTHPWFYDAQARAPQQHLRDEVAYPEGSPWRYNDIMAEDDG